MKDSLYDWEKVEEGSEEWEEYQELLEKLRKVLKRQETMENYNQEWGKLQEEEKEIINRIVRLRAAEIVDMAYHYNSGFDSVIHLDPDDGELSLSRWTGNTFLAPGSNLVEIYRLERNWIGNGCWDDVNDILTDEEWKELEEKYGDEADFMNDKQLESIGVDLDTRLKDFLRWCIEEDY